MRARELLAALGILLVIWGGWHLAEAQQSRGNPPVECVLAGGHWDIWNGWRCK
jgi:hypothetical protein